MSNRDKQPIGAGIPAGEWLNIFRGAKVEVERLDAAKSEQGRATVIGNFLARMVDREVPIEVDGRTGKATLRTAPGRGGKKLYWFDVAFDGDSSRDGDDNLSPGDNATPRKRQPTGAKKQKAETRNSPVDRTPAPGRVTAGNSESW